MKSKVLMGVLLILILIPVCAYLVLFEFNQFEAVVELYGPEEVVLPVGAVYEEPGAEAKLVGSVFFREGLYTDAGYSVLEQVDTSVPGEYLLTYQTHPVHTLSGSAQRRVIVLDEEPPRLTLTTFADSVTIYGEPYREEGYSAWDNAEGDITDRVIREEKDGFVTYTVCDSSGNRTSAARKICYVDPIPPVLTLLGGNTVTVLAGQGYQEPGWTAMDNLDGDLSEFVQVSGTVDAYRAGDYQLLYTVTDRSDNCTELYRTVTVQPKPVPETVYPEGKVIYLTFDDGPCCYTEQLLGILDDYGAKATFFVINSENLDVLSRIAEGGHSIGIHSVSHDYREIYASADAYFNDILTMQQIIYEKTGVMTYLMRFPGGSSNTVSRFNKGIMTYLTQAVEDMGFRYFDWNVDSNDAGGARNAKEVYENVINGVQWQRISVVLQHDIKPFSVEAVERILRWGNANGYRFLALDMTSPTAHHGVNN